MIKSNVSLGIQDGKIIIDPSDSMDPAVIHPIEEADIYINNRLIHEATEVFSASEIKIIPKVITVDSGKLDICISKDGLEAFASLRMKTICQYTLADHPTTSSLRPDITCHEFAKPVCTFPELLAEIQKAGIVHGLAPDNLKSVHTDMNGEYTLIAVGTPSQTGTDAQVIIHFKSEESFLPIDESTLRVNFRDRGIITAVESDQLVAEKIPSVPGIPGKTVTGAVIEPPSVKEIDLAPGKNTCLDDQGLKLFASTLGHPVLTEKGSRYTVHVDPVYTISGDVNLETGHIWYAGDLSIQGKISENMAVYSGGSTTLLEDMNGSEIVSEGDVLIRGNVINGCVIAGARQFFSHQVQEPLEVFVITYLDVLKAYKQLTEKSAPRQLRFGYVLNMLVENKFSQLPEQMSALENALEVPAQIMICESTRAEVENLKHAISKFYHFAYQDSQKAIELIRSAEKLRSSLNKSMHSKSSIRMPYCLNSKIKASGNISIEGQGSFHSDIHAHGAIKISGVVRGGLIESGHSLTISEVGSDAAIPTVLAVPKNETISTGKVFENTIVRFGQFAHRIQEKEHRVRFNFCRKTNSVQTTHY